MPIQLLHSIIVDFPTFHCHPMNLDLSHPEHHLSMEILRPSESSGMKIKKICKLVTMVTWLHETVMTERKTQTETEYFPKGQ